MNFVGMLFLGTFVGSIITLGLREVKDWSKIQIVLGTFLGGAFGGAVFGFIQFMAGGQPGDSIYAYPFGLVLGYMWVCVRDAAANIKAGHKLLGALHILGVTSLTVLIIWLILSPEMRDRLPSSTPPASTKPIEPTG